MKNRKTAWALDVHHVHIWAMLYFENHDMTLRAYFATDSV